MNREDLDRDVRDIKKGIDGLHESLLGQDDDLERARDRVRLLEKELIAANAQLNRPADDTLRSALREVEDDRDRWRRKALDLAQRAQPADDTWLWRQRVERLEREYDEAQSAITNLCEDRLKMASERDVALSRLAHLRKAMEDQRIALTQERDEARSAADEVAAKLAVAIQDAEREQRRSQREEVARSVREWQREQASVSDSYGDLLAIRRAGDALRKRLRTAGLML